MWKCKKCGGEVVAEVGMPSIIEFKINKNGNITKFNMECSLEEFFIDTEEVLYFNCTECDSFTGNAYIKELKEIAEWED